MTETELYINSSCSNALQAEREEKPKMPFESVVYILIELFQSSFGVDDITVLQSLGEEEIISLMLLTRCLVSCPCEIGFLE